MILILKHLAAACSHHTDAVVFIIIFIYVTFDDISITRSSQSTLFLLLIRPGVTRSVSF